MMITDAWDIPALPARAVCRQNLNMTREPWTFAGAYPWRLACHIRYGLAGDFETRAAFTRYIAADRRLELR